jgi:hypothetical protein
MSRNLTDRLMSRRFHILTFVAVVFLAIALLATGARRAAAFPHFPNTTRGIHLEMVFDYDVPTRFHFRGVDAVWAADRPVPGRIATAWVPFDRANATTSLQWWQANHPDWLEYRCDRSLATEFGSPKVPLDIANPAVREWQWSNEVLPAIRRGYQGIAFDNLNLTNSTNGMSRCGHYDLNGQWINQFGGPGGLQRYQNVVLSWARYMRDRLHSVNRLMGINYSYSPQVSWSQNLALLSMPDLVFDEAGVTNGGQPGDNVASYRDWRLIFRAVWQIQSRGVCYQLNGEEPQDTGSIPLAEREWIIGNYLLLKSRCTFVYITGFRAYQATAHAPTHGDRDQAYGVYNNFPEFHLPIGKPTSRPKTRNGLWYRLYSGGLVLVNPSDSAHSRRIAKPLYALGRRARARSFTVPAHSALILLRVRAE